jgi:predicted RNase H-like HicB family nuclease
MKGFVALIGEGPEGGYCASFPDFPTVTTMGETPEHARTRAQYALSCHVRQLMAEGKAIPEPSSLKAIMDDPWYHGALKTMAAALVEIDVNGDDDGEDSYRDLRVKGESMNRSPAVRYPNI